MDDFINSSSQSRLIHRYLDLLAERTAALERRVEVDEIRQLRQENRELREQLAILEEKDRECSENFLVASPSETEKSVVDDESGVLFSYYVGYCWLGKFMVCIFQGGSDGEWYSLGISNVSFFKLYCTQSPRAETGDVLEGDFDLLLHEINLPSPYLDRKVFARIAGPATIELCTAASLDAVEQGDSDNVMTLNLGQ